MEIRRCVRCMAELEQDARFCPACGFDQQDNRQPASSLSRNTILHGRYLVGDMIGQGGFGMTYVGFDLTLEMKVAVKEYFPVGGASRSGAYSSQVSWEFTDAATGIDRFEKEARRMARLDAIPAVVRVRDVFQENGTAYIVMDYVEGVTLKAWLMEHGAIDWAACRSLLSPVMDALEVIHGRGFIHRDISPDNIMVQPDGSAKLLDMGAVVDIRGGMGYASMAVAKKNFSAPEQYVESGALGSWTDVYGMAATIYYCLTGKVIPEAMERLYQNTSVSFPPERNIPPEVRSALERALQIQAQERTGSMGEFKEQLEKSARLKSKPEPAPVPGTEAGAAATAKKAGKGKLKGKYAAAAAIVAAAMLLLCTLLYLARSDEDGAMQTAEYDADTLGNEYFLEKADMEKESVSEAHVQDETGVEAKEDTADGDTANEDTADDDTAGGDMKGKDVQAAVAETDESKSAESGREAETVKASKIPKTLMPDTLDSYSSGAGVFGSDWKRKEITSIIVSNTLDGEPDDSWDVSAEKDGTVKAWVKKASGECVLHIAADGGVSLPQNCCQLFYGYENAIKIDLSCAYTGNVTSMSSMFDWCLNLKELNISSFNTSGVTDMNAMFMACYELKSLDVSGFDTSRVVDMYGIFWDCQSLTNLDVSGFDTSNVTNMAYMFNGCSGLTSLDVSGFDTSKVTDMSFMFCDCSSLTGLDVSGFDTSCVTDYAHFMDYTIWEDSGWESMFE